MTYLTQFEKDVENISKLPDRPTLEEGYTCEKLKALFDKAAADIKYYINNTLIHELTNSGASKIGSDAIDGVYGTTVQEKLSALKEIINGIENGVIPDNSIGADKFASDIADFIKSGSFRFIAYSEPGEYTFTAPRSGLYKITVVGGGGGSVITNSFPFTSGGYSGGAAVGAFTLEKGYEYQLCVGAGGSGAAVDEGGHKTADAQPGGDSYFGRAGNNLIYADGGKEGASAWGGGINIKGSEPAFSRVEATSNRDYYVFGKGTSSLYGLGKGGNAPRLSSDSQGNYVFWGIESGGNGAVIIEYIS